MKMLNLMLSFCFICMELCGDRGFVGVGDAVFEHILQINFPNSRGIIIIFINCNWVVTRWQWLFYMYTKYEAGY